MSKIILYHGDCLEVMKDIPSNSVNAVITDIPYGTTSCSWDEVIPFKPMWEQIGRLTNLFITTASQPFTGKLVMSNLEWFRYEWIWKKSRPTNFLECKRQPLKEHENILVFSKNRHNYYPIGLTNVCIKTGRKNKAGNDGVYRTIKGEDYVQTVGNYPRTIIEVKSINNYLHPSQKPITLYKYLIRTYTKKGDTVADITMGSGTTGVACVQTGRNFIGIEIDKKYFEIAKKRIKKAQIQLKQEA